MGNYMVLLSLFRHLIGFAPALASPLFHFSVSSQFLLIFFFVFDVFLLSFFFFFGTHVIYSTVVALKGAGVNIN